MRLGFWNRLAIVALVLWTLIMPTYLMMDNINKSAAAQESGYQHCMQMANSQSADGTLTPRWCSDTWRQHDENRWTMWLSAAGLFALIGVVIYMLIAGAVWVAKWVWRGRSKKNTETA